MCFSLRRGMEVLRPEGLTAHIPENIGPSRCLAFFVPVTVISALQTLGATNTAGDPFTLDISSHMVPAATTVLLWVPPASPRPSRGQSTTASQTYDDY
ncbi:hypothetical protein BKA93DRAFT_763862 [Sparassis latifolia]